MKTQRMDTRTLVECALLLAVGFVLSYIKIWRMPQGGSITLVSMLPILLIGLRHGPIPGMIGGVAYAALQMIQGLDFIHPIQLLLDYVLAFSALGFSGFFRDWKRFGFQVSAVLLIAVRFVCSTISGAVYWGDMTDPLAAFVGSAVYNGSYLLPEMILTVVVGTILIKIPRLNLLNAQPAV
ncbi:energy-coupled thiamine transporter ThiT [Oscillospiraceae bacterium OttesenSCG-928-F05]|nr:energy-coupled thiamine transporter ThiT [Oscillospiraceae bacterium OttesenSCG-928-F05]